tara:strand:+ start:101 stop:802 length:702 start_codon:yes stop_codon:yes gene_type:complete
MRHQQIQTVIDTPETRQFLKDLFQKNLTEGTDKTSVLRFGEALVDILKDEVGSFRGKRVTTGNTGWRTEIKSMFSGRGRQWIKVGIDKVLPRLDKFDEDGINTSDYRKWIENHGYAWIRFNGPRINDGVNCGGFEIRTSGSKIDHPKQLCYIPMELLSEDKIERLSGTPHSMSLEVITEKVVEETIEETIEEITNQDEETKVFDCIHEECVDPECTGHDDEVVVDNGDDIYSV